MKYKNKKGSAISLVVIFASLMLVMGLAYSKMTQGSKRQTNQIDERIKLNYAIDSMSEIALVKFQMYPAQYYACKELGGSYLNTFLDNKSGGTFLINDTHSVSSFNNKPVHCELVSMETLTNQECQVEALKIEVYANYEDMFHRNIEKRGIRLFETTRTTDTNALK